MNKLFSNKSGYLLLRSSRDEPQLTWTMYTFPLTSEMILANVSISVISAEAGLEFS